MINFNHWRPRATALVVCAAMLLSACQTTQVDTANMTPEERRLHEQSQMMQRTTWEGAAAGVIVGALLGALLTRGDGKRRMQGAAIGAAAGGLLGAAAGHYVGQKKQTYANEEARIDSMTSDVKAENANMERYVATARDVMKADTAKIETLEKQVASGQVSKDEASRRLASVDNNTAEIRRTIASMKEKQDVYSQALADARASGGNRAQTAAMEKEIGALRQQIAELEGDLDTLVKRRRVSRIG